MASKARKLYDTAKLQSGAGSLQYSIKMLQGCTQLLIAAKFPSDLTQNIILEAFLLHTRELIAFFYPLGNAKTDPDTVRAKDFFAPPNTWTPPEITTTLKDAQTRLNKLLAHLSYSRVNLQHEWDLRNLQRFANRANQFQDES